MSIYLTYNQIIVRKSELESMIRKKQIILSDLLVAQSLKEAFNADILLEKKIIDSMITEKIMLENLIEFYDNLL